MTRARVAAAVAAIITALLLQATVIGPVFGWWAVSLPAVVVAAVALVDGPAAGMSFGFAAGLVADLGSRHPAGVLALCWLGVGLAAGLSDDQRRTLRAAVIVAITCGLSGVTSTLLLALTDQGGSVRDAALGAVPVAAVSALLALGIVPLARRMLHNEYLRAPHPVFTELSVEPARGR